MKQLHQPMFRMPAGWCEIEIKEKDLGAYIKAFHEQEAINLPHGSFFVDSFWVSRHSRTEVYLRPVPPTWEQTK